MPVDPADADRATPEYEEAERVEAWTAECIEVLERDGPEAFEALMLAHPADADRVRSRLGTLSRLGLLATDDTDAGEWIGPYRVVDRLGSGGMGEVVLAEHGETGRRVALKFGPQQQSPLTPSHDQHAKRAAERFAREVQAVAALSHPAIVPVVEVGQHKGRAWFAMEFVEGVGLDRVLEAIRASGVSGERLSGRDLAAAVPGADLDAFGPTWVGAVGRVVHAIASALVEVHAAGIVHRDIKPSNILLRPDGRVQIIDFGLAHVGDMPTLTLSGEFAGTPYYIAPEQIANVRGGVDGRADQFSLGVTLYECASLRRPFAGRTPVEVLTAITSREATPLRRAAQHLPLDLERLCHKALEKDPRHRYATMEEFAADLGRFLDFRPLQARPLSPVQRARRWARRRPWRAVCAVLAALLIVGGPIALLVANSKIRSERDRVLDQARRSGMVVEHFVEHFGRTGAAPGVDEAARVLLDRGARRLQHAFGDEPSVRASLLHASARAYLELGRPNDARPLLDRALGIWLGEGADALDERARVLADLARVHLAEQRPGIAKDLALRALAEVSGSTALPEFEQRVQTTIAAAHVALGESGLAAERLLALDLVRDSVAHDVASVWEAIGQHELSAAKPTAARQAFRSALELLVRAWAPDGDRLARVHDGLADATEALDGPGTPEGVEHRARAARLRSAPSERFAADPTVVPFPFQRAPAWAGAYAATFDRGVAALQAGRLDEARECFTEAHACRPSPGVAAYNLACVESRSGRIELAATWLGRARDGGFACTEVRARALAGDAEIEAVRDSVLGQTALASLQQQWRSACAFRERSVLLPGASSTQAPASGSPLIVVIHDHGESAADAAEGPWSELAEHVGATLLVPSAPFFVGAGPSDGSAWSPDPRDLFRQPESFGAPVLDEVRAALQRGDVDREYVWIVGRGIGALLALDLLIENPGLFRRGWLVDPVLHPKSGAASGRLPRALGARLGVTFTEHDLAPVALANEADAHAAAVEAWLRTAGDWGDSVRVERGSLGVNSGLLPWWSAR